MIYWSGSCIIYSSEIAVSCVSKYIIKSNRRICLSYTMHVAELNSLNQTSSAILKVNKNVKLTHKNQLKDKLYVYLFFTSFCSFLLKINVLQTVLICSHNNQYHEHDLTNHSKKTETRCSDHSTPAYGSNWRKHLYFGIFFLYFIFWSYVQAVSLSTSSSELPNKHLVIINIVSSSNTLSLTVTIYPKHQLLGCGSIRGHLGRVDQLDLVQWNKYSPFRFTAEVCMALEGAVVITTIGVQLNPHKLTIFANETPCVSGRSPL